MASMILVVVSKLQVLMVCTVELLLNDPPRKGQCIINF